MEGQAEQVGGGVTASTILAGLPDLAAEHVEEERVPPLQDLVLVHGKDPAPDVQLDLGSPRGRHRQHAPLLLPHRLHPLTQVLELGPEPRLGAEHRGMQGAEGSECILGYVFELHHVQDVT